MGKVLRSKKAPNTLSKKHLKRVRSKGGVTHPGLLGEPKGGERISEKKEGKTRIGVPLQWERLGVHLRVIAKRMKGVPAREGGTRSSEACERETSPFLQVPRGPCLPSLDKRGRVAPKKKKKKGTRQVNWIREGAGNSG